MSTYQLKKILFYLLPPFIMDLIVKIYRKLFTENPKQFYEDEAPEDINFSLVGYSTEGLVMNISSNKIRYFGGISFTDEQHHFIQYYNQGIKALETFYDAHKPKGIFQKHYIKTYRIAKKLIFDLLIFIYDK